MLSNFLTLVPRLLRDPRILMNAVVSDRRAAEHLFAASGFSCVSLSVYGFLMGLPHSIEQAVASAVKLPLLFAITTLVCLLALYTFGLVMVSMRLGLLQLTAVVVSGVGISGFLLLGLAPVLFFLMITGPSYALAQLAAGGFVAIAGAIGMGHVWRALSQFGFAENSADTRWGRPVLLLWLAMYGIVGTQLAGFIGPFVAPRGARFMLVERSQEGIVMDVVRALQQLLRESTHSLGALFAFVVSVAVLLLLLLSVIAMLRRQARALPITHKPGQPPHIIDKAPPRPPAA